MEKKLDFTELLKGAIDTGLKNFPSLVGAVALWLVTIWIPYLNVGTTIAIITLPAALSRGKVISPVEIFDEKYRKFMGEFFLVTGLRSIILVPAYFFMIIPGIIMQIAYCLSTLLVVDKGKGASEALQLSNKLTHGNKLTIFLAQLILGAVFVVVFLLANWIHTVLGIIILILFIPIILGLMAHIYGALAADVKEE